MMFALTHSTRSVSQVMQWASHCLSLVAEKRNPLPFRHVSSLRPSNTLGWNAHVSMVFLKLLAALCKSFPVTCRCSRVSLSVFISACSATFSNHASHAASISARLFLLSSSFPLLPRRFCNFFYLFERRKPFFSRSSCSIRIYLIHAIALLLVCHKCSASIAGA